MRLSRSVVVYIIIVTVLGAAVAASCFLRYPFGGSGTPWLLIAAFVVLGALGDRFYLQLSPGTHVHVDTIPFFAAVLIFSPSEAVLIAALGRLLGSATRPILQVERVFNLFQTMFYVGASALILSRFTTTPWRPEGWQTTVGLLAAAAAMYLLNTGVVAGIVGIQSHTSPLKHWINGSAETALQDLVMLSYGALMALVVVPYPWSLPLFLIPTVVVFLTLDRTLKTEAQQKLLAEANAVLASDLSQQTGKLREAYTTLEDALFAKNQMLQNVSHELRTPLVSISGYTEALEEGIFGELVPAQKTALDIVRRNTDLMIQLVNDLLALQAIDRAQLQLEEVQPVALLEWCADRFAPRAAAGCVNMRLEAAPDTPLLRADVIRMEQAVGNLVDNAIKFSPDGGQVLLRSGNGPDGTVEISVADQGIGIPEAALPRIFDPFYQVDGSTTRRFQGQGLGLAIAKRIVELHGGSIRVESQVGCGTTLTITLPASVVSAMPEPAL